MTAEKMADYLWGLPEQFAEIIRQPLELPAKYKRSYQNVVVTGLGGSAIGGDILRCYAQPRAEIPLMVNRDYSLPAFVDSVSLVLAVSYSGNTEETLSAAQAALDKGAAVVAVTSGGKLAELARRHECAVVTIPGGMSPRAATGYLFAPLALILAGLNIIPDPIPDISETVQVLTTIRERNQPGLELAANWARQIARNMKGRLPIIWGSSGNTETAAMRWKTQINENAKCPAYYNIFPELNHNEIVGFDVPQDLLKRQVVVILKDTDDHPRVAKRMAISESIISGRIDRVIKVDSLGDSWLARFYSLVYLGDYASYYLALEYGVNPTPVEVIDYLKAELGKEA